MELDAELEAASLVHKTSASPSMLVQQNMEPRLGIEPRSVAYQTTALPLSYLGWSQDWHLQPDIRVTSAALSYLSYPGENGAGGR